MNSNFKREFVIELYKKGKNTQQILEGSEENHFI